MATFLPSSGAISINDINGVFSRGNNLNAYNGTSYYTVAGGATASNFPSSTISMSNFYGTGPSPNFTLAFNDVDTFGVASYSTISTSQSNIRINTDGSISLYCVYDSGQVIHGPTAWGDPLTVGIGSLYEFRVIMTYVHIYSVGSFIVAGTSYTSPTTTPWISLSSNQLMTTNSGYASTDSTGTIEIRNTSTLATISRGYYMYSEGNML